MPDFSRSNRYFLERRFSGCFRVLIGSYRELDNIEVCTICSVPGGETG
jgi:hypothetical protein